MGLARTLHTGARFLMASKLARPQLLGVGWVLTETCNSKCPFCSRHSGPYGVDTQTALDIVDQLADAGCRRVHMSGGEPLMRKDLEVILRRVHERGMVTSVNTNGALLTERKGVIDEADAFLVSVDGPREIHDGYRGAGSFARLVEGLELLNRRRKRFVFSVTLLKENLDHVDFFIDFAERFGARVALQPGATHVLGSDDENPEMPDIERYRAILKDLLDDPAKRRWIWNSRPGLEQLIAWPEQHRLASHAGRISVRLAVDGSMYPCSRAVLDPACNPAPNVLELGVAEAFRRLERIDCSQHNCQCSHNIEKNLLYGWDPDALWNYVTRNYMDLRHSLA